MTRMSEVESNQEIVSFRFVSFRLCARDCARSACLVEFEPESRDRPFPFSFWLGELSLSPCVFYVFHSAFLLVMGIGLTSSRTIVNG